jgi:hypothetical protein
MTAISRASIVLGMAKVQRTHGSPTLTLTQACQMLGEQIAQHLAGDEREELRAELEASLAARDWGALAEALEAWRATAEVLSDPALAARPPRGG